jgi:hypothetical protein
MTVPQQLIWHAVTYCELFKLFTLWRVRGTHSGPVHICISVCRVFPAGIENRHDRVILAQQWKRNGFHF